MAYISLQNVFAVSSFWNDKGLEVEERFPRKDGTEGKTKYSVFFDQPHGIANGSKIEKLGGIAGVKARIYDPEDGEARAVADITINNPKVEGVSGGAPSAPATPAADLEQPF